MIVRAAAAAFALVLATLAAAPTPAPSPAPSPSPVPSASASPAAPLASYTGQLLSLQNGYVFFTSGDAFKTVATVRVVDKATGLATTLAPAPKLYATAILDPATHEVTELQLSRTPLPQGSTVADLGGFVVQKTGTKPNPALANASKGYSGKQVPVAFIVEVPPETPINSTIYVSTDESGWNPQAIPLDRVDATHYKIVRDFASGTRFAYRVTRGSWNSVEVGQNGMEVTHTFFVREIDAEAARTVVYRWADERGTGQVQVSPDAIPTPFNANPFPAGGIFPGPPGARPPGGPPTTTPGSPNLPPGAR